MDDGLPDALIAEPGFSALVRVTSGGRERVILFDAGVTPSGVVENMRRLELSPRDIETIVSATVTGTTSPGWRESRRSSAAGTSPY
jgi:metal-dependent hydrolase (beta-lactamase superfamily II)